MTRRSGFKQTNVPAQTRTIVKVAKVWLDDDAHVTIYAEGRKGFERQPLRNLCACPQRSGGGPGRLLFGKPPARDSALATARACGRSRLVSRRQPC
jgi:hypothetical protein